jgi:hypothetical protein
MGEWGGEFKEDDIFEIKKEIEPQRTQGPTTSNYWDADSKNLLNYEIS